MIEKPRRCNRCGLLKAAWMYWTNGAGKPATWCKSCHPQWRRERMTPERRARINAYERARYHADGARRRQKIAQAVARNRRIRETAREDAA